MPTEAAESVSFDDTDSDGVVDTEPATKEAVVADRVPFTGESLGKFCLADWFHGKLWLSIFRGCRRKRQLEGTRVADFMPSIFFLGGM